MKKAKTLLLSMILLPLANVFGQATTGAITAVDYTDSEFVSSDEYTVDRTSDTNLGGDESKVLTYRNRVRTLNEFSVGTDTYTPLAITPSDIFLRRTTIANTFENIVWTQTTGGFNNNSDAFTLEGPRFDSAIDAFTGNNMFVGMDNMFQNTGGVNVSNVQRLDVVFGGGVSVNEFSSFAIFERGGNDPFRIAAITSLDIDGNPAGYGTVHDHTTAWGALYQVQTLVTRSEGTVEEPHAPSDLVVGSGTLQSINGVNISVVESLGISSGATIYGYSLFAGDVTGTGNQLVDWTNSDFFPTDTTAANGGLDMLAYHGIYVVPEPGALILAGILLASAFIGLRRRR